MAGGRGALGAASGSGASPLGGEALAGGDDCGAGFGAATGCVSETGVGAGGETSAGGGALVGGGAGGAAVACADDRLAARGGFRRAGRSAARPSARASRGLGAGSAGGALGVGRERGLSSSSRMALPAASEAQNRPAHDAATGSVRRRVMTGVRSRRRRPGQDQGSSTSESPMLAAEVGSTRVLASAASNSAAGRSGGSWKSKFHTIDVIASTRNSWLLFSATASMPGPVGSAGGCCTTWRSPGSSAGEAARTAIERS
jgi:hypothetical protein